MNIHVCTKYGLDSLIISGSYGGHRWHTADDGWPTTDNARGMAYIIPIKLEGDPLPLSFMQRNTSNLIELGIHISSPHVS